MTVGEDKVQKRRPTAEQRMAKRSNQTTSHSPQEKKGKTKRRKGPRAELSQQTKRPTTT